MLEADDAPSPDPIAIAIPITATTLAAAANAPTERVPDEAAAADCPEAAPAFWRETPRPVFEAWDWASAIDAGNRSTKARA